jgi:hypothetical protein
MVTAEIDRDKYGGNYIATRTFENDEILVSGPDPLEVYNEAIEMGIEDPVINYVHKEGVVCLY